MTATGIFEIVLVIFVIIGFIATARFLFGFIPRRKAKTRYDDNHMTPKSLERNQS